VVINICSSAREAREVFYRFAGAVDKYIGIKINYLGYIQQDESLRAAVTMQSPVALLSDSDPSSKRFFQLAESLEEAVSTEAAIPSFAAYWQRLSRNGPAQVSPEEKSVGVTTSREVQQSTSFRAAEAHADVRHGRYAETVRPRGQAHHFDEKRFGSQDELLRRLLEQPDLPLMTLLESSERAW